MKPIAKTLILAACLMLIAGLTQAQDNFGVRDTVYADVAKVDDNTWTITVSYLNDEDIVGMEVHFLMDAGVNKIVADSAVYKGGRIMEAEWAYPGFRCDTAGQTVTLGMMANIANTNHRLTPGSGRLLTVFVSSLEDKPIEKLTIDTLTARPGGSLLSVMDLLQGVPPDTTRIDVSERKIRPAWVVRYQ